MCRFLSRRSSFAAFSGLLILAASSLAHNSATAAEVIHAGLRASLDTKERVDILVSMSRGTGSVLTQARSQQFSSRGDRATAAYEALKAYADQSQEGVLTLLKAPHFANSFEEVRSFWISNQVYVQGADRNLIESLAQLTSVSLVEEDRVVTLQEPTVRREAGKHVENGTLALQWNIRRMKAPEAWEALGSNGSGATVAVIDTGARATHVLLRDSYKGGTHSWYDATNTTSTDTPVDQYWGYGTFNLGLMAGADGYGVAPGAKWIACKSFVDIYATRSALLACGQFVACPHDAYGQKPDCSQAPDVVTNSWQSEDVDYDWFGPVIDAWHAAGVIPVFGAGNGGTGNACRTITYPAEHEDVIAVGATQYNSDYIASYSSRGPAASGGQKPQVAAPGDNVSSADSYNDVNIVTFFGASQAPPHVAGLVALLRAARPELTFEEVRHIVQENANRDGASYLQQCAGRFDFVWPNYHFGYGRVDALASVSALLQS